MTKYIFQISRKSNAISVPENSLSYLPCKMKGVEECSGSKTQSLSCQLFNGFPAPVGSKSNYRLRQKYSKWETDCLALPKLLENKSKNWGPFNELKGNFPSFTPETSGSSWHGLFQTGRRNPVARHFFVLLSKGPTLKSMEDNELLNNSLPPTLVLCFSSKFFGSQGWEDGVHGFPMSSQQTFFSQALIPVAQ